MSFTIAIEPQIEAGLRAQAAERGVSVEAEIARRLTFSTLTDEEREELEDELDVAAANWAREPLAPIRAGVKRWTICVALAYAEFHQRTRRDTDLSCLSVGVASTLWCSLTF